MYCDTTKDNWDKLRNIYEGNEKSKGDKIQIFISKFEQLKMKEDEEIGSYLLQVDEIFKTINRLGV
jgi:hypothetical protein